MRIALPILLSLHGTVHLLGFVKWSGLGSLPSPNQTLLALSPTGERVVALGWLAAFVTFVGAAALHGRRRDSWWMLALGGVLLSQGLILLGWSDARFGMLANAIIAVPIAVAVAQARFNLRVDTEVRALYQAHPYASASLVDRAEIERFPAPVHRWLASSGIVGRERARSVRLEQCGELRAAVGAPWMPARAVQHFLVDPPAFIWKVDATMLRFIPIAGRDKYFAGHGNMLIKAASLVNLVNASDEQIDQGSMLRFLGEIVWFPSAALSPRIAWESIDATHANATLRYGGLSVSAVFEFDAHGRVVGIRAERHLGGGADAKLTPWLVSCSEWRTFDGVQVPSRGEVAWALASGKFSYYRWEILEVEYNPPKLYSNDTTHRSSRRVRPVTFAATRASH